MPSFAIRRARRGTGDTSAARRTAVWTLLAALLAAPVGCRKPEAVAGGRPAAGPVPVATAVATEQDVPVQLRAIGRVEPYSTVSLKPQVTGLITAVHFAEGQEVKADEVLFSLDARPFEAALRQAEGILARDEALARDAQREAERSTDLFQQGVATQREYDTALATAEAQRAAVTADKAAVEQARLNVEYCTIRAPIDGRTGSLLVYPGNVVKANEGNLVVINQIHPINVTFSVAEQHLTTMHQYHSAAPLRVTALLDPNEVVTEQGELTFIDNAVDRTTGMILLKGTFSNEDRKLWPGLFVNVLLTLTTRANAVVVPAQAVQTAQLGQFVFIVRDDQTVEMRPVVSGPTLGGLVVINEGVSAGETVVTDGQLRLVRGAKIVEKPASTTQKAAP